MKGFYIKELIIAGDSVKDARIVLQKGLNVINGPSNTGKSYILQCIDYMFGAKAIKKIPEIEGYNKVYLEIRNFENDEPVTLLRLISENKMYYCMSKINEFDETEMKELKTQHDGKKEDNISKFLLKKIGVDKNKVLVKNARGEKNTLSFRGIANLSLINETKIISEEKSPILDSESVNDTYCKSIFRYLLTQKDDVECVEIEKREIRKAKLEAKIEYVNSEMLELNEKKNIIEEKLNEVKEAPNIDEYQKEVEELEAIINAKQLNLKQEMKRQDELNSQRNRTGLLLDKFNLLRKQYISDLKRLTFIEDGRHYLKQININHCPVCNSEVEFEEESLENIIPACEVERKKIKINLIELEDTMKGLIKEKDSLTLGIGQYQISVENRSKEISGILEKRLNPLKVIIRETIKISNLKDRKKQIEEKIFDKTRDLISFNEKQSEKQPKLDYSLNISNNIYEDFCTSIKNTLIDWNYKNGKDVKFDIEEQDIVVDGAERKTNGKGYRAYFYSAFSVTLLNYLASKDYPFTKVLILDSPLTTLKEEDVKNGKVEEGDIIEETLQDSMFISLANNCENKQIIIIENKEVPKEIENKCNHIIFTKKESDGRYGFFPLKN